MSRMSCYACSLFEPVIYFVYLAEIDTDSNFVKSFSQQQGVFPV